MTLLNRSSAILGLGTVHAKNELEEEDVGEGVRTRATAKPTNPSTTATPPTAPGLGLFTTAFNPSFTIPPVRTPR